MVIEAVYGETWQYGNESGFDVERPSPNRVDRFSRVRHAFLGLGFMLFGLEIQSNSYYICTFIIYITSIL